MHDTSQVGSSNFLLKWVALLTFLSHLGAIFAVQARIKMVLMARPPHPANMTPLTASEHFLPNLHISAPL